MVSPNGQASVQGLADAGQGGQSIQRPLNYEQAPYAPLVFQLASVADDISPWGEQQVLRDQQLRSFWPTESLLASAIYSIVARNAAFSWTLEGPPRTVTAVQDRLHMADEGRGWQQFVMKITTDLLTQDNGAFIEVIRSGPGEGDPVVGIAHLDAGRCRRTGVPEFPVVYTDRRGLQHKLRPHQVIAWAEFPSPVETMNGVGLCAVSRVLRMAQLLRDIAVYQREKVGGRNPQALYLVSGISTRMIDDAIAANKARKDAQGLARFTLPVVIGSLDPTATVAVDKVELASLPDNFDADVTLRWYITQLALGFGADYQDFAPMSLGGLGSSAQSLVLHMKSRGKGPALFMKGLEYYFNFHGVMPRNVTFRYDEQDMAADTETAQLRKTRAEARKLDIETGVLTPEGGRQQMLDDGDLTPELFEAMQAAPDLTQDITAPDNDPERDREQPRRTGVGARTGIRPAPTSLPVQPATAPGAKAAGDDGPDFAEEDRSEWQEDMTEAMDRALRAMFRDVRSRILSGSGKGLFAFPWAKKDEAGALELPDDATFWQEFRVRMVGEMLPFVREIANGAADYSANLGLAVDMDLVNAAVLDYSRTYVNDWWSSLEATTREGMRKAIVAWQETGLGERGLPDLVDALEPLFGTARAERIAVTETTRLFNEGNKLAYASAGLSEVEYQTARDDLVCPICGPLNSQRFPLGSAPAPPRHVNCRCALLPVANDQAIGGRG